MKPMLATAVALDQVQFPVYASPKLDGIRAVVHPDYVDPVRSRTLKPIPNAFIQKTLSHKAWPGMDGELIVGARTARDVFNKTTSGVMSGDGEPDFTYWVFDLWDITDDYTERLKVIHQYHANDHVKILPQLLIQSRDGLELYEQSILNQGYEGVMLRKPDSPYKFGRSTLRQGYLLKRKPLADAEGIILGFEYLQRNYNEATLNDVGYTKRSQSQENLVTDYHRVGALIVRVLTGEFEGVEVKIGTGFTDQVRLDLALDAPDLEGKVITFTYQAEGAKDRPRFPSFKGFRKD